MFRLSYRLSFRRLFVLFIALSMAACGGGDDADGGGQPGTGITGGETLSLDVNPGSITFPAVPIGDHDERVVTLRHVGKSGIIQLRNIRLESDTTEYQLEGPAELDLAVGDSVAFKVTYDPVDGEQDSGVLRIDTNVLTDNGPLTVEVPIEALAQVGDLVAVPNPIHFKEVVGGTTKVEVVEFTNAGADNLLVVQLGMGLDSSADFTVGAVPQLPVALGPGDGFTCTVSYTPTSGSSDSGTMRVTMDLDGAQDVLVVPVTGIEKGAVLDAYPGELDFGSRPIDETHTLPIFVQNAGTLPLEITNIGWLPGSSDTLGFANGPTETISIAHATDDESGLPKTFELTVTFSPTSHMQQTTAPIGNILFESNDSAQGGTMVVPVYGRAEVPALQVLPPDFVDFAFVAQNLEATRTVHLYNAGNADLTVTAVTIEDNPTGEFAVVMDEAWGPTASSPTPAILSPGAYHEFLVSFTNEGPDNGTEWAKLRILSNDGQKGDWPLDLQAKRAGSPVCEVTLVPGQLDFGIVPRGFSKTMSMNLVVSGSGNCSFDSVFVNNCASWGGFFETGCDDPETTILKDGNSEYYTVQHAIPAIAGFLKPGDVYPIDVTFTPPDTAPLFGDETTDYGGLLGVRVIDPYLPQPADYEIFPKPAGGGPLSGEYSSNLHAKSGMAELSVFPGELDFGSVTIGCHSQTLTIHAYNVGTAPLDLTNWELQGCSPEFKVKSWPALPKTLGPQEGVEFEVVYVPQDPGGDSCSLTLTTNEADTPSVVVPLLGSGTFEDHQVDIFIQTSGQDVDVLFVVDNSGSMGEEQSNLATNFKQFINGASTWNNDYHVGVTTTDVDATGGKLVGDPRYVTNSNWQDFESNVKVGSTGSGTEQGLVAAQLALSLPNIADSSVACGSDGDCSPEVCVDGFCGGANRGFMRKDASLEVVFVSDEEDQSPADLNFYINFFKSLKGFFNDNLIHIHAIVGPPGGCSSSSGDASAGHRYMDAASATGGNIISICEADFAAGLASIGEIAFGLKVQFFLTRVADPPTIEVRVSGVDCSAKTGGTTNWTYDAPSNSVVFNETGGCMPQPGEEIQIEYDTICFLE